MTRGDRRHSGRGTGPFAKYHGGMAAYSLAGLTGLGSGDRWSARWLVPAPGRFTPVPGALLFRQLGLVMNLVQTPFRLHIAAQCASRSARSHMVQLPAPILICACVDGASEWQATSRRRSSWLGSRMVGFNIVLASWSGEFLLWADLLFLPE